MSHHSFRSLCPWVYLLGKRLIPTCTYNFLYESFYCLKFCLYMHTTEVRIIADSNKNLSLTQDDTVWIKPAWWKWWPNTSGKATQMAYYLFKDSVWCDILFLLTCCVMLSGVQYGESNNLRDRTPLCSQLRASYFLVAYCTCFHFSLWCWEFRYCTVNGGKNFIWGQVMDEKLQSAGNNMASVIPCRNYLYIGTLMLGRVSTTIILPLLWTICCIYLSEWGYLKAIWDY